MAISPALIFNDNPGATPASYKLPASSAVELSSVTAVWNGAAAGAAFLACLSVYSQSGVLLSRTFPSTQYAIGDSGEVTYAPFLGREGEPAQVEELHGVRVRRTTNQSIPSGPLTAVSFDAEAFDTDGYHSNAVNPTRLTVPAGLAGYYHIGVNATWEANATVSTRYIAVLNSIGGGVGASQHTEPTNPGLDLSAFCSEIRFLGVGNYVEMVAQQTSGVALNLLTLGDYSPVAWMYLVGT